MGMNLLPLCTASVCPTNSGSTVQRRAQVLSTRFSPLRLSVSIFRTRESTTYGPFLMERAMWSGSLLLLPAAHDERIAQLATTGFEALGDLAPRRARVTAARGLALATAHGVVDGIHRDAPHRRRVAQPAAAAGLAERDVLVIEVAHLADDGAAVHVELAHLPRRQAQLRVLALLRHELAEGPGRAHDARAAAGMELDVVDV